MRMSDTKACWLLAKITEKLNSFEVLSSCDLFTLPESKLDIDAEYASYS